jgi:hypothetical protein
LFLADSLESRTELVLSDYGASKPFLKVLDFDCLIPLLTSGLFLSCPESKFFFGVTCNLANISAGCVVLLQPAPVDKATQVLLI